MTLKEQAAIAARALLGASGPFATLLIAKGMQPQDVSLWSTVALGLLTILTPILSAIWDAVANRISTRLASFASLPEAEKAKTMAALPTATQASIVAAAPAEVQIASVANMDQVQKVVVDNTATDGVKTAAADSTLPNVITQAVDQKDMKGT